MCSPDGRPGGRYELQLGLESVATTCLAHASMPRRIAFKRSLSDGGATSDRGGWSLSVRESASSGCGALLRQWISIAGANLDGSNFDPEYIGRFPAQKSDTHAAWRLTPLTSTGLMCSGSYRPCESRRHRSRSLVHHGPRKHAGWPRRKASLLGQHRRRREWASQIGRMPASISGSALAWTDPAGLL